MGFSSAKYVLCDHQISGHSGTIPGVKNQLIHWPQHEVTIAISANNDQMYPIDIAAEIVADMADYDLKPLQEAMTLNIKHWQSLLGTY